MAEKEFVILAMIKKQITKTEQRDEIQRQTQKFLKHGQQVKEIPKGVSSRDEAAGPLPKTSWHMEKSDTQRTYLTEVVDSLEQRKQIKSSTVASKRPARPKKPKRKLIYDDFGEPLRWVWVDE